MAGSFGTGMKQIPALGAERGVLEIAVNADTQTDLSWASCSEIPPACLETKILGGEIQLVIFTKPFPTSLQRMPLQGTS